MGKRKVLIVGNGLFGSIAARLCDLWDYDVTVFDHKHPEAASPASGNLTKPSWLTKLGKRGEIGLSVLDSMFELQTLKVKTLKKVKIELLHVPPQSVAWQKTIDKTVVEVNDGWLRTSDGQIYDGNILVAAGVWSSDLVEMPIIKHLTGASMIFRGEPQVPKLSLWAPYKHSVSFPIAPGFTWFGDGTAKIRENFSDKEIERTKKHARKHGLKSEPVAIRTGRRPYVDGNSSGYFRRVYPNVWVSTGGAKNGIVLAAYQATLFIEELEKL